MNHDFLTKRTHRLLLSGYPLEISTTKCAPFDTPYMHCHDEVEFCHILKGCTRITCDGRQTTANEGDIIFINRSVHHMAAAAGNDTVKIHSIIVHPSFIIGFDQPELKNKYLNPVLENSAFPYLQIIHGSGLYQQTAPLLEQLTLIYNTRFCGYELLSKACLLQIWKHIYDGFINAHPFKTKTDSSSQDALRTQQAILYIQKHFMEPVTLYNIADSILVSKSECCRCFKRVTGISPFEYLMKYRITEAVRHMQLNTRESISEIAGAVGFNNTSYFNKVFRKFMNCTPTQYRQSLILPDDI